MAGEVVLTREQFDMLLRAVTEKAPCQLPHYPCTRQHNDYWYTPKYPWYPVLSTNSTTMPKPNQVSIT